MFSLLPRPRASCSKRPTSSLGITMIVCVRLPCRAWRPGNQVFPTALSTTKLVLYKAPHVMYRWQFRIWITCIFQNTPRTVCFVVRVDKIVELASSVRLWLEEYYAHSYFREHLQLINMMHFAFRGVDEHASCNNRKPFILVMLLMTTNRTSAI